MPNYNKKISETAIRIGEVRFGYVNVFAPRASEGNDPKYSVQILIPKTNTQANQMLDAAMAAAAANGASKFKNGKIPANLKTPLRDGDEEFPDDPNYEGMWFMNASSKAEYKPGVAVLENGQVVDALDSDDFYSGCWGAVSLNFFAYNSNGNQGIGAGLNNVIKTRDGEKLSGGKSAKEDFADMGLLD
jgi:hypothetical protein